MPDTPDEELVRRLLADARHDEPMPADVAGRLDGVLADLVRDEPPAARHTEGAVRLRSAHDVRRGRRRLAGAFLAAAAIVVAGVAVRSLPSSSDGDSGGSSASSAYDNEAGSDAAGGSSTDSGDSAAPSGRPAEDAVRLHRATLRADVRRAVEQHRRRFAAPSPGPTASAACPGGDVGAGTAVPALLDGTSVVLVLRPPRDGRQVADVLACGTARVLASVTVPAP
jgi:hypothetical protein